MAKFYATISNRFEMKVVGTNFLILLAASHAAYQTIHQPDSNPTDTQAVAEAEGSAPDRHPGILPKLADPDSPCVDSSGTSIAKTYGGPMRYGHSARAPTLEKASQAFRSLVFDGTFPETFSLGLNAKETPRDAAFCAHVVYSREPMIVPEAFQDVRFADNPVVTNEPRIRFYAGYPLKLDDGSCIGTLCLLDTRPRTLEGPDLERLHDLADIALREILGFTTQ